MRTRTYLERNSPVRRSGFSLLGQWQPERQTKLRRNICTLLQRLTRKEFHGGSAHKYEWVKGWGQLPEGMQFGNTHGCIVIDGRGRVLVNTDTENAVIIFDSSGKFLNSGGKDFKGGAHG